MQRNKKQKKRNRTKEQKKRKEKIKKNRNPPPQKKEKNNRRGEKNKLRKKNFFVCLIGFLLFSFHPSILAHLPFPCLHLSKQNKKNKQRREWRFDAYLLGLVKTSQAYCYCTNPIHLLALLLTMLLLPSVDHDDVAIVALCWSQWCCYCAPMCCSCKSINHTS